jgi:hypothetical protein
LKQTNADPPPGNKKRINNNPLLFVFFCGRIGGFFNAVMRFHSPKPHTGYGPIVNQSINPVFKEIAQNPYGAKGFTFAFLTGFSERIILPDLRYKFNE